MSELKTIESATAVIENVHLVYRMSEVDKVIAEKDKEIMELKGQVNGFKNRSNLWHYNAIEEHKKFVQIDLQMKELKSACKDKDDWCLHTLKQLRHQKYKRCLANAWWCRKLSNTYTLSAYTHRGWKIARYYDEKAELYRKWHKRWLAIAEKFKPNKEAK